MIRRVLLLVLLAGLGYWLYTSGIYYCLSHGLDAEPGRVCEIAGPSGDGVFIASDKDALHFAIDSRIGSGQEKLEARTRLSNAMNQGDITAVPDHTQVSVLESGRVFFLGAGYALTKVRLVGGTNNGAEGWVQREDVIDTPIQQMYQAMRGVHAKDAAEATGATQ